MDPWRPFNGVTLGAVNAPATRTVTAHLNIDKATLDTVPREKLVIVAYGTSNRARRSSLSVTREGQLFRGIFENRSMPAANRAYCLEVQAAHQTNHVVMGADGLRVSCRLQSFDVRRCQGDQVRPLRWPAASVAAVR